MARPILREDGPNPRWRWKSNSSQAQQPSLLGGDFAGYLVEFSPKDASLLPIPSKYVPDELLLWGQAPTSWEVLVSERTNRTPTFAFQRTTASVLPGVGCGLDSLDTLRATQVYHWHSNDSNSGGGATIRKANTNTILRVGQDKEDGSISTLDVLLNTSQCEQRGEPKQHRQNELVTTWEMELETLFALPVTNHRLRVSLQVSVSCHTDTDDSRHHQYRYQVSRARPIRTYWERRYDPMAREDAALQRLASNAKDVNGHLDAGTVFGLIGDDLRGWKTDLSQLPIPTEGTMGTGKGSPDPSDDAKPVLALALPKHLSIVTGPILQRQDQQEKEGWFLEVSLCDRNQNTNTESDTDTDTAQRRTRKVVRREFRGFDRTVVWQ